MTNFENLKNMTKEELADWLDKYGQFDGSPWMEWFSKNYCNHRNCPSIEVETEFGKSECAYCELQHKCKFFLELEEAPNNKEIILMWLDKEETK